MATRQASFTLASGATDHATYFIAPSYRDLSPGDPGYVANSNPIVGLTVSDSQGSQGGITFDPGMNVTILTQGGTSYGNSSPFSVKKARSPAPLGRRSREADATRTDREASAL